MGLVIITLLSTDDKTDKLIKTYINLITIYKINIKLIKVYKVK